MKHVICKMFIFCFTMYIIIIKKYSYNSLYKHVSEIKIHQLANKICIRFTYFMFYLVKVKKNCLTSIASSMLPTLTLFTLKCLMFRADLVYTLYAAV